MPPTARSRSTVHDALDDVERLISAGSASLADRLRPLRVVEGSVTTDRANRLVYEVESASDTDGEQPRRVILDGVWRLNARHELELRLSRTAASMSRTIALRGALVHAGLNSLVFALRGQNDESFLRAPRLTLSGRWQADAHNRLTFLVDKANHATDRLTLQGGWTVGAHHELIYRYRQPDSTRPVGWPNDHTLTFAGAWDMPRANRLVYRLSGSADAALEFSASLQSRALQAREGRLVYQVGVRLAGRARHQQRVSLFGTWKFHKRAAISFEVPYADGQVRAIYFEGTVTLGPRQHVAIALRTPAGEPLGLTLTLTRQMAQDAGLFVQVRQDGRARSVIGGVRVRF